MTNESEQYRAGFEAWARNNGHPVRFNADGSYAGMNSYRFEGYVGAMREAGAEPSACDVCGCTEASCNGCAKTVLMAGDEKKPAG